MEITATLYQRHGQETFKLDHTFYEVKALIESITLGHQDLRELHDILAVQLPEGVFIKSTNAAWSQLLGELAELNDPTIRIQIIPATTWIHIMQQHHAPIDFLGNEKLATWKSALSRN
jgi:hypothetical protein